MRSPKLFAGAVALALLCCSAAGSFGEETSTQTLYTVYSSGTMAGFNPVDAKAAVTIWEDLVIKESKLAARADGRFCDSVQEMIEAFQSGHGDIGLVLAQEYFELDKRVPMGFLMRPYRGKEPEAEYLLLVHKESPLKQIEDLRGRSLTIHENVESGLARAWLEVALAEKKLGMAGSFLKKLTVATKLTGVVLPVFFRKTDACIISRTGFDIMVELNPQVGKQLRILAVSPKLITAIVCIRRDYPPADRDRLVAAIENMGKTVAGQQMMNLWQAPHITRIETSQLAVTRKLWEDYVRLSAERGPSPAAAPSPEKPKEGAH